MPPPNGTPPARKRSPTSGEAPAAKRPGAEPPKRTTTSGASAAAKKPAPPPSAIVPVERPPESLAAKLVCSAGPKSGTEFVLSVEETVIGRAADATISLPDTSVSRRHVQVRRVAGGWACSDLGSGNGTQINGEVISEEVPLHNGDVITIGDSELTFFDAENATDKRPLPVRRSLSDVPVRRTGLAQPAARPRVMRTGLAQAPEQATRKNRLKLVAVVFPLACVVLYGATIGYRRWNDQKQTKLHAQEAQKKLQVSEIFQEAKNLIRQGRWAEARTQMERIKRLDPSFIAVEDYIKASEHEMPNEEALNAAQAALKDSHIAATAQALAKVSSDTQQFQLLGKLKQQLEDRLLSRLQDGRLLQQQAPKVSTAQDTSKWDEVVAITDDILRAYPDNRDAKVLHDEATQAIHVLKTPKPVAGPPPAHPWDGAINLFLDGDVTGAFSVANACAGKFSRCKTLLGQMTDFQNLYKKLEDLDAKGLSQLLALDTKITDGRMSKMARTAGTRAATIYFKSAAAAKAAGQFARALQYAMMALKADPGHVGAQGIISELRQRARETFLYAYTNRETNPEEAIAKFKEVISMTPPDDEYHDKAKHWLDELTKQ